MDVTVERIANEPTNRAKSFVFKSFFPFKGAISSEVNIDFVHIKLVLYNAGNEYAYGSMHAGCLVHRKGR